MQFSRLIGFVTAVLAASSTVSAQACLCNPRPLTVPVAPVLDSLSGAIGSTTITITLPGLPIPIPPIPVNNVLGLISGLANLPETVLISAPLCEVLMGKCNDAGTCIGNEDICPA